MRTASAKHTTAAPGSDHCLTVRAGIHERAFSALFTEFVPFFPGSAEDYVNLISILGVFQPLSEHLYPCLISNRGTNVLKQVKNRPQDRKEAGKRLFSRLKGVHFFKKALKTPMLSPGCAHAVFRSRPGRPPASLSHGYPVTQPFCPRSSVTCSPAPSSSAPTLPAGWRPRPTGYPPSPGSSPLPGARRSAEGSGSAG